MAPRGTQTIENVPPDRVDDVMQEFRDDGATNVRKEPQGSNFKVIAEFPD
jgi:hypothetical protein